MKMIFLLMILMSSAASASVTVTVNGSNHTIPQTNERGWGNAVTAWIQAITSYTLQPTGGSFTLSNDVDFGASYGLKAPYYLTRVANPATAGLLRLAKTDTIGFRNNANSANLLLGIDASDNLTFNSVVVPTNSSASTLTNKTIDAASNTITNISNSEIKAAAAIALNKLAATTANKALVSDGSGFVSASSVTDTELGYVSGVTSAIQTQIDSKQATGNYITSLTGDVTASGPGSVAATIGAGKVTNAMLAGSIDLTAKVTGALPVANGGTGQSSFTKGDLLAASAATTLSKLGVGADGTVLTADSAQATGIKWGTALSNPMTTSGDIIYGGASGVATRLAKGTDGQALTLASGIPAWSTITLTSGNTSGERVERAKVTTNAGTCAVNYQSGSWITSTTHNADGDCTLNLNSSMFSVTTMSCTCTPAASANYICNTDMGTSGQLRIRIKNTSGTLVATGLDVICMGPR